LPDKYQTSGLPCIDMMSHTKAKMAIATNKYGRMYPKIDFLGFASFIRPPEAIFVLVIYFD